MLVTLGTKVNQNFLVGVDIGENPVQQGSQHNGNVLGLITLATHFQNINSRIQKMLKNLEQGTSD